MRKPTRPVTQNRDLTAELSAADLQAVTGGDGEDVDSIEKAARRSGRRVEFQLVSETTTTTVG